MAAKPVEVDEPAKSKKAFADELRPARSVRAKASASPRRNGDGRIVVVAAQNPHREGSFAFDHFARAQKSDTVGDYLARFEDGKARNTARQWLWNFPQVGQRARRGLTSPWSKTVKRSAPLRRGFFFVSALARLPTSLGASVAAFPQGWRWVYALGAPRTPRTRRASSCTPG